ncbi:MAG: hypothetical protein IJ955_08155 [Oscillospiraceae bacterium]|nr:hypothetical protein [Oscillospiraceae bacterium]
MTDRTDFFTDCFEEDGAKENLHQQTTAPRKSVVQIHFPARNMTLSYYNDQFNLKRGDSVYVDGKLEGLRGRVVDVNYNFKIKLSDYKRVIAKVDTEVSGQFFLAGSHLVSFDRNALPVDKVTLWFKAPSIDEDEYTSGSDDSFFCLENLEDMDVSYMVMARGEEYYKSNRVKYLCVDDTHGHAIVEGSSIYDVEFEYCDGKILGLTCSCFCGGNCKHEVAVMLQLREILNLIEGHYQEKYDDTGYFSAILEGVFFNIAIDGKRSGSLILE